MWRPSEFKEEYIDRLEEYFDVEATETKEIITTWKWDFKKVEPKEFAVNFPTLQKYCYDIRIDKETLLIWAKQWKDPEYDKPDKELKVRFFGAYTRAKQKQESIWLENSLKNLYNPQFAIFLWKNVFWYKDKTESDVKVSWEIKDPSSVVASLNAHRDKVVGE